MPGSRPPYAPVADKHMWHRGIYLVEGTAETKNQPTVTEISPLATFA